MNSRRRQFWKKCDQDFEMGVEQIYDIAGKDHISEFSRFVTLSFVDKNPKLNWVWYNLNQNTLITLEFVEKHLHRPWSWYWLGENLSVTPEFVERNSDKPWNWSYFFQWREQSLKNKKW